MKRVYESVQDKLTADEIRNLLIGYEEIKNIDDIKKLPTGTFLRYFSLDPESKQYKFRIGGKLIHTDQFPEKIALSNGHLARWYVVVENTIFYRQLSYNEIVETVTKQEKIKYEKILTEQKNKYETLINQLKSKNKALSNRLSKQG